MPFPASFQEVYTVLTLATLGSENREMICIRGTRKLGKRSEMNSKVWLGMIMNLGWSEIWYRQNDSRKGEKHF